MHCVYNSNRKNKMSNNKTNNTLKSHNKKDLSITS